MIFCALVVGKVSEIGGPRSQLIIEPSLQGNVKQGHDKTKQKQGRFKMRIPVTPRTPRVFNPFKPKSDLIDFTLSNTRRFYSSKGDPLGVKGLIKTAK